MKEEIKQELDSIYEELLAGFSDDPVLIRERLNYLAITQTRLGFIHKTNLSDLRAKRFAEIKDLLNMIITEKLSAKVQNSIIECIATDTQELCDYSDRLLSSIDKHIRVGMTLLSYAKAELKNTNLY